MDQQETKRLVKSAGLPAISLVGRSRGRLAGRPRSRIMPDFPAFRIVFKYGVIWLENPQEFKIGLAHLRILVISQELYANWFGLDRE